MPRLVARIALLLALLIPSLAFAGDAAPLGFVGWAKTFAPIAILLVVVAFVIGRLPKVELGHSPAFLKRRVMNWLPLGLTYSFLYMGRYNLKVSKHAFESMSDGAGGALMSNEAFGTIFAIGTVVYGLSFLLNGPLTDRYGGKFSILMGAGGASVMNAAMGVASWSLLHHGPGSDLLAKHFVLVFSVLYALNMYFQSFGAVAIVKVNASWFHVNERGVFGAIFGILISLGVYFAFDWSTLLLDHAGLEGQQVDHVPMDTHVGSIAVRRLIERRQPWLTLHGHVQGSWRRTGSWKQKLGRTTMINAAHDGPQLALVRIDLDRPFDAERELIGV